MEMNIGRERDARESNEIELSTMGAKCGVERILDLKLEDMEPHFFSPVTCVVLGGSFISLNLGFFICKTNKQANKQTFPN